MKLTMLTIIPGVLFRTIYVPHSLFDFDRKVIGQISKEGFISKDDKMELVPADSNQVK